MFNSSTNVNGISPRKLFVLAALALSIAAEALPASAGSLADAKTSGVIIGIANDPPLMRMDENGSPAGLGPELDKAILNEIGISKVTGQVMEYGALIPALQSKRVDISSGGALFIKPERCEAVAFSDPISCDGAGFIIPVSLVGKVKTFKDVADQSLRIGVCGGCVEQQYAIKAGVSEDKIVVYPESVSGLKLLIDKRIDVFATSANVASDLQRNGDSSTKFVQAEDVPLGCGGAAFNKEDVELRDAYNEGLKKIRANGKYMEILKKYGKEGVAFGVDKASLEKLCAK